MHARSLNVLARCGWLACALLLFFYSPAYAQEEGPVLAAAHVGERTVMILTSNWTASATDAQLTLTSSAGVKKVEAPDWWNATASDNTVTLTMIENVANSSKFIIHTNSTSASYSYRLILNGTQYDGRIPVKAPAKESHFAKWTDQKEGAATAFIPEGWSADLQIIRPYKTMTGFVFFARGSDNTLVYVFQPFMPMHILPNDSLCDDAGLCPGTVSAEKVREMSFGNAPIAISDLKTPEQYFASEVLPVLRKNLNAYSVVSERPAYALEYGANSTEMIPVDDVEYSFEVEGKKIGGRAMIFTRNHTAGDAGIWNGFIVGVESSETNFDAAIQQASVALLTLQFDEQWLANERRVLIENTNATGVFGTATELMANSTLDDFDVIVQTAAHKLVRTYNNTMIGGYLDSETMQELHLPLFPDTQHWFLSSDQLVGRKSNWNPMNSTSLDPLF